jgi:hypothetical protein
MNEIERILRLRQEVEALRERYSNVYDPASFAACRLFRKYYALVKRLEEAEYVFSDALISDL